MRQPWGLLVTRRDRQTFLRLGWSSSSFVGEGLCKSVCQKEDKTKANPLVSLGATFKPRQILASHFIDLLLWGGHLMSILANSLGGVRRYPTHVQHVPCTITAGIWRGCYSRLDGPQYNQPSRNSLTVQKPGPPSVFSWSFSTSLVASLSLSFSERVGGHFA